MPAILSNWNLMRILRMGMGLWLIYSAFADRQPLLGLMGGLFALQAALNVGCCGAGGCASPNVGRPSTSLKDEPVYEEVK